MNIKASAVCTIANNTFGKFLSSLFKLFMRIGYVSTMRIPAQRLHFLISVYIKLYREKYILQKI